MGLHGGEGNQRFNAPEAFGKLDELDLGQHLRNQGGVIYFKGYHAAIAAGLAFMDGMAVVQGQAGIEHAADFGVFQQPAGNGERVGVVLFHAQRQGFQTAYEQPAIAGAENSAGGILQKPYFGGQFRLFGDDDAAQQVVVPCKVFGAAMYDKVGAKLQRTLKLGSQKGIIDNKL